jgi:hypothetical protein
VIRPLVVLSLFATVSAFGFTPLAPRQIVDDTFSNRSRENVYAATNGRTFIVTWGDRLFGAYPDTATAKARTFDAEGQPQQSLPLTIPGVDTPAVAPAGDHWIIASSDVIDRFDPFPTARLRAWTLSEDALHASDGVLLAETPRGNSLTGVVTNADEALIANVADAVVTGFDLTPRVRFPAGMRPLATTGTTYLGFNAAGNAVVTSRAGSVLSSVAVSGFVSGAAHGGEYGVVFTTRSSVEALTLDDAGNVTGRATLQTNATPAFTSLVWSGDSYLAAWGNLDMLCTARFTAASKQAAQCTAAWAPPLGIALADNGTRTMIAWSTRTLTSTVHAAFFPSGTTELGGQQWTLTTAYEPQAHPHLDTDANGAEAVWSEAGVANNVWLGGMNRDGSVRTPRLLALLPPVPGGIDAHLARGNGATLVVWSSALHVYGTLAYDDGTTAMLTLGDGHEPDVAFDGSEWLVVWIGPGAQIASSLVSANGSATAPNMLAPSQYAQTHPAVASRGTDFLVAWAEQRDLPQVMAIGVARSGFPSGSPLDLAASTVLSDVQVAASGRFYLIVVASPEIGFPVTSIIPDILVAGVREYQPYAVHAKPGGGFVVLENGQLRIVDAFGHDRLGGALRADDFAFDGTRFVTVSTRDGEVGVDIAEPRQRATVSQ